MYKQLTQEQRYAIYLGLTRKQSYKEIAKEIGVAPSTLTREVKRNLSKNGKYLWTLAQNRAMQRRFKTTTNRKIDPSLISQVKQIILEKQWSPQQISGYLKKQKKFISHEKIYQIIREDTSGKLKECCRHKMKYHKSKHKKVKAMKPLIQDRTSIHDRPIPENNNWMGYWEMDLILGKNNHGAILTLMEKSTNYLLMTKLKHGKNAKALAYEVHRLLLPFKKQIQNITTDNGLEFSQHKRISKLLGTKVYFTDPYASWQKGAIENTNKLIRQYIPKGTNFNSISEHFLHTIQTKINQRPRQKLNFSTPSYCFLKLFN